MGWTAASVPVLKTAPTWDEWSARQQNVLSREKQQPKSIAFSERELARLAFVRWLYQKGCLDPMRNDNI
jgi:hypothetical protein